MSPLPSFAYTAPTQVWFAPNGLDRLGSYLRRAGVERALLVCDPALEAGIAPQALEAAGGRVAEVFAGVAPDAPREAVEAGAEAARRAQADAVVALGGGSALDSGKAIAALARHGGDIARFDGVNKIGKPGLPVFAIPTTAGTGSEATNIAVVLDAAAARKLVLIDRALYPQVAILDPRLTAALPPALTAATGIDALTHAIEGIVSTYRQPICDAIGLECVRLVRAHLPRAVREGTNLDARGRMLLAASMAGQLVSMTFSGISHAVAHALGIGFRVHHGTANGIALPWSIRFNAASPAAEGYARCAEAFGIPRRIDDVPTALALADAVEELVASLGLPTRLSQVGVGADQLPALAALAFADPSHRTNPVSLPSADVLVDHLQALL
jgi:alcohol dehydrogenase class IV